MKVKALAWGAAFLLAGLAVAQGWVASGWSAGPRGGAAMTLLTLGALVAVMGNMGWILRRTTRPEDYAGGCPVGATCPCGHFNFKPRRSCKACGAPTAFS